MSERKSNFWPIAFVITMILLVIVPVSLLYFSTAGLVYGEEFSPDDFSRRSFSYNVAPLINYPILGISYQPSTSDLERNLVLDGLITSSAAAKWDLVKDSSSAPNSIDFDARFLTNYLDLKDKDGASRFSEWNDNHPKSAKVFWPIIADLARSQLYWAIPNMMRTALATNKDDEPEFHSYLNSAAAQAFNDQALSVQKNKDDKLAIELFSKSIGYSPRRSAYLGRSQSYKNSGELNKCSEDENSAKNLGN